MQKRNIYIYTYQGGVKCRRVRPQGHVALGAVGPGAVHGVCEGGDPGVSAEESGPVLTGTDCLSRVGVCHDGAAIFTTGSGDGGQGGGGGGRHQDLKIEHQKGQRVLIYSESNLYLNMLSVSTA